MNMIIVDFKIDIISIAQNRSDGLSVSSVAEKIILARRFFKLSKNVNLR